MAKLLYDSGGVADTTGTVGSDTLLQFTTVGRVVKIRFDKDTVAQVMCVGGGGGGGGPGNNRSGGGGGGGVYYNSAFTFVGGTTYNITVGAGGAGGRNSDGIAGGASSVGSLTGGGGVGGLANRGGYGNGSHGGASGTPQSYAGGLDGGGGGGAGGAAVNAGGTGYSAGGTGASVAIIGTSTYYGGGGGGGAGGGSGGAGGGGAAGGYNVLGVNGTNGLGGGGGGCGGYAGGGNGGNGIVIIRGNFSVITAPKTLTSSGAISMADIQDVFGGGFPISMSEYYSADSGVPASGTISVGTFYAKAKPYVASYTTNIVNYTIPAAAGGYGEGFYRTVTSYTNSGRAGTVRMFGNCGAWAITSYGAETNKTKQWGMRIYVDGVIVKEQAVTYYGPYHTYWDFTTTFTKTTYAYLSAYVWGSGGGVNDSVTGGQWAIGAE